jgi:general secretion pathway protein C
MSYAQRAADLISIVLVIAIAVLAAELTWRLVDGETRRYTVPDVSMTPQAPRDSAASGYREVAALHLFGAPQSAPKAARSVPVAAPPTSLQLTLRGVLATGNAGSAIAIIADDRGRELPYRVGDAISDQVRVKGIEPQRVLLNHNGRDEVLELPAKRLEGTAAARSSTAAQAVDAVPDRTGAVSRNLINNPSAIARHIALQPVNLDGGGQGYRVSPLGEGLLFESAGLERGDVIVAINGITFDDPEALGKLLMELRRSDRFMLDLDNGETRQKLSILLE